MASEQPTSTPPADLPKWSDIQAAGNIRNWVDAELGRRGLRDDGVDVSKLSDKKRKEYKAAR
jgi:RNA-directed DNA polymerase